MDWAQAGLKPGYDAGALVVLRDLPEGTGPLFLRGPIGPGERRLRLDPRRAADGTPFHEFYVLSEGRYSLSASWGETAFEVGPARQLGFGVEFGIFFAACALLVGLMAWRYLGGRSRNGVV